MEVTITVKLELDDKLEQNFRFALQQAAQMSIRDLFVTDVVIIRGEYKQAVGTLQRTE